MDYLSELQPANTGMVLADELPSTPIRTVVPDFGLWARITFTYTDSPLAKSGWRIGLYGLIITIIGVAYAIGSDFLW